MQQVEATQAALQSSSGGSASAHKTKSCCDAREFPTYHYTLFLHTLGDSEAQFSPYRQGVHNLIAE